MGGKKQQAQRTKNNAKHSSSGRTAELLSNSSQFSSFTSLKGVYATSTSSVNLDVFDSQLDPNLIVILKKLNKKDAVTRFKALNELVSLLKDLDDDSVINLLPCWVKFYNNLVVDVDHKVREATQIAHKTISLRAGRNMAPYVKQIVPSWFVSQCDTHPPAASAASQAFKEAFPPHKIVDAIVFCQSEIVKFISANLLSEKVIAKKDEQIDAKIERITIACLNGYALYLSRIPSQSMESVMDYNREIVSSPQFWAFQDDKSRNYFLRVLKTSIDVAHYSQCLPERLYTEASLSVNLSDDRFWRAPVFNRLNYTYEAMVRTAFFTLLTSLLQNAPTVLETQHKPLTNAIFSKMDEYDPVVLASVWESVLHLITVFPDCWQHVNVEKLFLNKITNIISSGGQGSANVIFPNILPLLSKIPKEVMKNESQFYNRIFSSFRQGMTLPCVVQSLTESEAVTSSFHECVRFIILKNLDKNDLCRMIVKDHLVIQHSKLMTDPAFRLLINPFYYGFVQNLIFWQRNCEVEPEYLLHLNYIWESLPMINTKNIEKFGEDSKKMSFIYECHILFVDAVNRPFPKKKKNVKVMFVRKEELDIENRTVENPPAALDSVEQAVQAKLYPFIDELMKLYFSIACNHESQEVKAKNVEQLWKLTCTLNQIQLNKLSRTYAKELCPALISWLGSDYIPIKYILGLIFNTLENVEESDRGSLLSQLSQIRFDESMLEVINVASHKMSESKIFKDWLQSERIRQAITNSLLETIDSPSNCVSFIEKCCSTYKTGEPVLGANTLLSLFNTLVTSLLAKEAPTTFLSAVFDSLLIEKYRAIVLTCRNSILELLFIAFSVTLSENGEVYQSWKKGINFSFHLLTNSEISLFVDKCLHFLLGLLNSREQPSITCVNKAAELIFCLCITCEELAASSSSKKELEKYSKVALTQVMDEIWDDRCSSIEELVYLSEVVKGNSLCSPPSDDHPSKLTSEQFQSGIRAPLEEFQIVKFANSLMFCSKYLAMVSGAVVVEEFGNTDFDLLREKMSCNLNSVDLLSRLAHGLLLGKRCNAGFPSVKECSELHNYCIPVEFDLKELIQRLRQEQQNTLFEVIENRTKDNGGRNVWKLTLALVQNDILERTPEVLEGELPAEFEITSEFLHMVRTTCKDKEYIGRVWGTIVDTYRSSSYSIFNKELSAVNTDQLRLNAEIGLLAQMLIEKHSEIIDERGWDFLLISVASWFINISTAKSTDTSMQLAQFLVSTTNLLVAFIHHFVVNEEAASSNLYDEWKKLFANETYAILRKTWTILAEKTSTDISTPLSLLLVTCLGEAICSLCEWNIPEGNFVTLENEKHFVFSCMKLVTTPYIPIQVTAYLMLCNAISHFVTEDAKITEKNLSQLSCQSCLETIGTAQNVVTTLLHDYRIGISCAVCPYTDGYTYTLAYLMLWSWLVELCRACNDSQLRYVYTLWIKENNLVPNIMESIYKLMPESLLYLEDANVRKKKELFSSRPIISFESWTSEKLSQFSCWLYIAVLRTLPAVVRQWTTETEPKFLSLVDKVTTSYVSPILCDEELEAIKKEQVTFNNVQVQTHTTVREVIATYTIEETSTELTIKLPNNYPLCPPKVEVSNAIKSSNQNRQQLMQLTLFLTHQNGSIWDGLLLWKSNLDKKFEGVEECYICFSIVHNSSHQLPKMACQTCRKKFHSFCLYRWFTTSSMSSCPICRDHF